MSMRLARSRTLLGAFIAALCVLLATPAPAEDQARTITSGGSARTFVVFIPERVKAARRPAPVVLVLHGGLGTGTQVRRHMGFDAVAEREGLIAVYPDGLYRGWNDGRVDLQRRRSGEPDDVAFLRQIVRALQSEGLAESGRVFAIGVSNGGMMAFRLACEASEDFNGIVTVIANLSVELSRACAPKRGIPVLAIQGTKDPLMPWSGGGVGLRGERGQVISADATLAHWVKVNGCGTRPETSALPDRDPGDGTSLKLERYSCPEARRVARITVVNGGHTVPSLRASTQPLLDAFLGRRNSDIETAEVAWRFLAGQDLR